MHKTAVHIISHTHWDREWYLNSPYVNEWLPPFFDALLAMMEKEKDYCFVLDGQTSIVDDCTEELKKQGLSAEAFLSRIATYARQGRLILGPYYLQPDWQLISEEAIVHNLLIGQRMSRELGGGTATGWLLDNFGQIAQTAQIHKQFGMQGIVVWRGVELNPHRMRSEFFWRSPDNTVLPCGYLLSSYRNAMRLADDPELIQQRIRNEVEKIAPFAGADNILLMNGYDQEMQPDDILPYIRDGKADFGTYTVEQSTPDKYMAALAKGMKDAQELHGALYSGRYISVFPGILSSRMYLKQQNHFSQQLLSHFAEPLAVMAMLLGAEYPKEELAQNWKLLLKNHPHDSICGVSVDDVHSDMEERSRQVDEASYALMRRSAAQIASATDTSSFEGAKAVFTLFNTLPYPRRVQAFLPEHSGEARSACGQALLAQQVPGGMLVEALLPAMGFASVGIYPEALPVPPAPRDDFFGESTHLKLWINPDGTLGVTHKKTGHTYDPIGYLEDSADCGDEYNYSWLAGDKPLTTLGEKAEVTCIERGDLRTVFKIVREWRLPAGLSENRTQRSDDLAAVPIVTFVTLEREGDKVDFCTVLQNQCRDHRLRVLFPTHLQTDTSQAHTQFCITSHPICPPEIDNSQIPPEVSRIIIGARESEAITQFPQQEFVAVQDGSMGAALLNQGLPEYEVLAESTTVALTLFRSVGWLARFDLNTRIGDAGPEMFVPDAQCLREMQFHYAFMPFSGELAQSGVLETSQSYQTAALVVENSVHPGEIEPALSFLSAIQAPGLRYSAIKKAENSDDILIRAYHIGQSAMEAGIEAPAESASSLTLGEEKLEDLTVLHHAVTLPIAPGQIATLACRIPRAKVTLPQREIKLCPWLRHGAQLAKVPLAASATLEDIQREELRADQAEAAYARALAEHAHMEEALTNKPLSREDKKALALLSLQVQSLLRAALEARLSAILARKNLLGEKPDAQLTDTIRKIAYRLNLARIGKRASEYIKDYYQQPE